MVNWSECGVVNSVILFDVYIGVLSAARSVVKDQADLNEKTSMKQRLMLAGGSAIGGSASKALRATVAEELQPLMDGLDVTGMSYLGNLQF